MDSPRRPGKLDGVLEFLPCLRRVITQQIHRLTQFAQCVGQNLSTFANRKRQELRTVVFKKSRGLFQNVGATIAFERIPIVLRARRSVECAADVGFRYLRDFADEACAIRRIEHGRGIPCRSPCPTQSGLRGKRLQRLLHRRDHRLALGRIGPDEAGGVLAARQHVGRQRDAGIAQRCFPAECRHGVGNDVIERRFVVGKTIDEGCVRAVLEKAAHEISKQIFVAADRRIDARADAFADVAIEIVQRLTHAVQALIFEIDAARRKRVDCGNRVRVVGRELRIDRILRRQHRPRASDVRCVGRSLACEHRIVDEPLLLPALDLGVPVGSLHQTHRNAPVLTARQIDQPIERRQRALLIALHCKAQPAPAFQRRRFPNSFEEVEHQVVAVGFLGVDGQRQIVRARLFAQRHHDRQQLAHHALALDPFVARMQRREFHRYAWPLEDRLAVFRMRRCYRRERVTV